jgi:hypothetical protein
MVTKAAAKRAALMEKAAREAKKKPTKAPEKPKIALIRSCPFCKMNGAHVELGFTEYKFVRCSNARCKAMGPRHADTKEAVDLWNAAKR